MGQNVSAGPVIEELVNTVKMLEREVAAKQVELLRDKVFIDQPGLYKSEDVASALTQLAGYIRQRMV